MWKKGPLTTFLTVLHLYPHNPYFHLFLPKMQQPFPSTPLPCYTANARKKQAKKQKQAKKHDDDSDHPSLS